MGQKETSEKLVALEQLQNSVESEMLQDLLRQEQIPVLVRDAEGIGGYMKIYMGNSVFGETLYVHEGDYARARELLQSLRQNSEAAILDAQPEAFDDADAFEEQAQSATQQSSEGQGKSQMVAVVILIVALLIAMWGLAH